MIVPITGGTTMSIGCGIRSMLGTEPAMRTGFGMRMRMPEWILVVGRMATRTTAATTTITIGPGSTMVLGRQFPTTIDNGMPPYLYYRVHEQQNKALAR